MERNSSARAAGCQHPADKPKRNIQHCRMQINCPQCHAVYEVGPLIKNAVLICHRCNTEFGADGKAISSKDKKAQPADNGLTLFEHAASDGEKQAAPSPETAVEDAADEAQGKEMTAATDASRKSIQESENTVRKNGILSISKILEESPDKAPPAMPKQETAEIPPSAVEEDAGEHPPAATEENAGEPIALRRGKSRIWPWLTAILLLLGGGGFYFKQDVWLNHPWVRSMLININIPLPLRNEDWVVVSDNVQAQWITRQDNSRALLIEGTVENQLYCSMTPPKILIRFFEPASDSVIAEQLKNITEPPTAKQIEQAPYIAPAIDKVPVESRGTRAFILIIEESPEGANHFELSPIALPR